MCVCVPAAAAELEVPPSTSSLLADLTPEVSSALAALDGPPLASLPPGEQLEAVFRAVTPYQFSTGVVAAQTDSRWYSTRPSGGAGAPLLELRRWPGDTVLAIYAMRGGFSHTRDASPPLPGAGLTLQAGAGENGAEWRGEIETEAGIRPAVWLEIAVAGSESHLAALLLPGDAGLGLTGVAGLMEELRAVVSRIGVGREGWERVAAMEPGQPVQVPVMGGTPGDKTEEGDPWQVARGSGFTIGLPPGFRARRTDGGVQAPRAIPGQRLWLRGRTVDLEGNRLVVGDGTRAGYVAELKPLPDDWISGKHPPLGSPDATLAAGDDFPLAAERTGAKSATAERWSEKGFSGDWLVFRLLFEQDGIEIGLPVVEGRRSASLYWIPATWRAADRPPAPPPVDPDEMLGIRFERLRPAEQAEEPWTEGHLVVPGLRARVPKGWHPAASLRSKDGFPIGFVDRSGTSLARLTRVDAGELPTVATESAGWQPVKRPGRYRAVEAYVDERRAYLFVSREGHAFLFEPQQALDETKQAHWSLFMDSVQLMRAERGEKNRED